MSNADCIVLFITSAIVTICISIGVAKSILGEFEYDKSVIYSFLKTHWKMIEIHTEDINVLRARMCDLETKIKELENRNDS